MDVNAKKKALKKTIVDYLNTCENKRCFLRDFWNGIASFSKAKVSRKQYGVKKMNDLLPQLRDIIVYDDTAADGFVTLRGAYEDEVAEIFHVTHLEEAATPSQATSSSSTVMAWGSGAKAKTPAIPREVISLDSDDESDGSQNQSTSSQPGFIPFSREQTTSRPLMQAQPSHLRYGLGGSLRDSNITPDTSAQIPALPIQMPMMQPRGPEQFQSAHNFVTGPPIWNPQALSQTLGMMRFSSPAVRNPDQFDATNNRPVMSEFPKPHNRTGPPPGTKITEESKEIIVQPVRLPRGARLTSDQVNQQVLQCIELLSSANEHVSIERVENMILQKYQIHNFQALNLREKYFDRLPAANKHSLLLGKTNAYIQNFVRSRSLCTLYELGECCREFHPEKREFEQLKLGPLQKMPMIYEMFKFPLDEYVPEITTVDVLENLNNFLDKYNKWTSQTNVEDFMKYLMEVYNVTSAYSLGIRLRSLPLAIQMLKKSKRDAAATRKTVIESLKEILNSDVQEAFKSFQATILQTTADGRRELRLHYMNLQPEIAIKEILAKFELLAQIFTPTSQIRKTDKMLKNFDNFIKCVLEVPIPRMLLHLSVCMSNLEVQESATQFIEQQTKQQQEQAEVQEQRNQQQQRKLPPTKVALTDKTIFYMNRCLEHGALHLSYLQKIEAKLLEEFDFLSFREMGYGSFLDFVLGEPKIKKILDECGGTVLGSSSGDHEAESPFKPSQSELLEFICQSRHAGITQNQLVETILCEQFRVTDTRFLGYGNISRLCNSADKPGKHSSKEYHAHYEAALCGKICPITRCSSQVGIQGSQTREQAIACLTACPLLEDMAEWSHWSSVFQAQHGRLRDFVEKYGGQKMIDLKSGHKTATSDFMALEVEPGKLLKISSQSTPQLFLEALTSADAFAVAGHLVSLIAANKGLDGTPLALLANHVKTTLITLHARSQSVSTPGGPPSGGAMDLAVRFVADILLRLPLRICVAVANQVLLEPLSQVVGSAKSKSLMIQACQLPYQQQRLEMLGCLLGLPEWTSSMQLRFQFPPSCVTEIVADDLLGQSVVDIEEEQEGCDEEESDSDELSDIDTILSGDEEPTEQPKEEEKEEKEEKTGPLGKEGENEIENEEESSDEEDSDEEEEEDDETEDEEEDEKEEGCAEDENSPATSKEDDNAEKGAGGEERELTREEKCKSIVDMIRRKEFGVGIQLDETGQRLLLQFQERQGRSLERLSKDLYSKDTHFVLELIQNADDNSYTEETTPAIKFLIDETGVMIMNNEMGFEEKNIQALCDVGKSTKTKHNIGYIGQKGIGFKSVFRVTGRPEVHSNGFHICFDVNSGPMGYILPHWIEAPEDMEGWQTRIALPWTEEIKQQIHRHAARFNDIQPSLLLFLHRLREITIENKVENHQVFMRRQDLPNGEVQIAHSHGTDRWLVLRKILDASQVSLQAKSGVEVESTEIALAFPLRDKKVALHSQARLNKLPVFAFLPLRSYGFRFIVQGDFDVPSSREDVDRDSSWNQWLRNEIHVLFIEAFDAFKARPDLTPVEALSLYLQFIPLEGEVMDFFKPVASQILAKLRAEECMPVLTGDKDIQWKMPSKTVISHDSLVLEIVSPDLLQNLLGLYYLHPDITAILDSPHTQALGIESITTEHLLQIGKAISQNWDGAGNTGHVTDLAKWLACVYRSLDDFQDNSRVIDSLCKMNVIPLSDGSLVSLSDWTVFLLTDGYGKPALDKGKKRAGPDRDPLLELKKDLNLVHSSLISTSDNEVNSQVVKLLIKMGVKQMTAHDLIHSHIMPVLKSDAWQDKSRAVLISYLVYIKAEMDNNRSVVDKNELRSVVRLATNHGMKSPSEDDVHFSTAFGNPIDLSFRLPGIEWTLVDSAYLPHPCSKLDMLSWHDFLSDLGVVDFLRVRKMEQQFDKKDIGETAWAEYRDLWPDSPDGYTIVDFHCQELHSLVTANRRPEKMYEQMEALFEMLDTQWVSQYSRLTYTQLKSRSGHVLKDVIQTSFAIHLQTLAWVPSVWDSLSIEEDGKNVNVSHERTLETPSQLYVQVADIVSKLAYTVKYLKPTPSKNSTFTKFLEIKNSINVETVKMALISWGERNEGSPNLPKEFSASKEHMLELYFYLNDRLPRKDAQDLFHHHPVIFVPVVSPSEWEKKKITVGKMMRRTEVWWCDPTQLFVKYQNSLEMYKSPLAKNKILQSFYSNPDIRDVFLTTARVQAEPNTSDLAQLLKHIATVHTLSEEGVLTDTLFLFAKIGSALSKVKDTVMKGVPTDEAQKAQLYLPIVHELLSNAAVFPTKLDQWVSLTDHPMIADSIDLWKMFCNKPGVHFLQLEAIDRNSASYGRKRETRSTVDKESLMHFISLFEAIKPLSDCVKTEEITFGFQQCNKGQTYLHNIVGLLQRFLYFMFPDVYKQVKETKASSLKELLFSQVQKLEVKYELMDRPDVYEIRQETCVVNGKNFYFHEQYVNSQVEINKEIARYFSEGNEDCIRQLRDFLTQAVPILEGSSDETIEGLLSRQQVPVGALPPDEEIWEVPLPIIPVAPEPEPVVETMVYGRALSVPGSDTAIADGGDGGGDGLKSWPPKSGLVKDHVTKSRKETDKPSSGMWPPPKAPDYNTLSKELPSNIKFEKAVEEDPKKNEGFDNKDENFSRQLSNSGEGRPSKKDFDGGEEKGVVRHPSQTGDGKGLMRQTSSTGGEGGNKDETRHALDGGDGRAAHKQGDKRGTSRQGSEVEPRQGDDDSKGTADINKAQSMEGVNTGEKRKRKLTEGSREDDNVSLKRLNSEDPTGRGPRDGNQDTTHERHSNKDYDGQRRQEEGNEGRQRANDRDSSSSREVTPSSFGSNQDQRRQNKQKGMLQFTIPEWSESSEDIAYTELSRDKSLKIPQMKLDDEAQAGEIGQWGEMLVLDYLLRLKAENPKIEAVLWANAEGEKGLPYDFEIVFETDGADDFVSVFVEVKATVSWNKEVFKVSSRQIEFALQQKDKYQIYRVFGAGNSSPKLVRIDNVAERMRAHSVQLFMVI